VIDNPSPSAEALFVCRFRAAADTSFLMPSLLFLRTTVLGTALRSWLVLMRDLQPCDSDFSAAPSEKVFLAFSPSREPIRCACLIDDDGMALVGRQ